MDFAFFAIAFNIKKMCAKLMKKGMKRASTPQFEANNAKVMPFELTNGYFGNGRLKIAA